MPQLLSGSMKRLFTILGILLLCTQSYAQPGCVTHDISLNPGWNTISSYILPDDPDMDSIFNNIRSVVAIVKDGAGQVFVPGVFNQIGDWDIQDGYQVKANSSTTLSLQCSKVSPLLIPISVDAG